MRASSPSLHRLPLERRRAEQLADRTSFMRCRVVRREGTWRGTPATAFLG